MNIILKNCHIVDKEKDVFKDILIVDGIIEKIDENIEGDNIIDINGKTIMPAFIDMHSHFRDPGFLHKEDLTSGSRSALAGGYTTINLMANTNPICDSEEKRKDIVKRAKEIGLIDIFQTVSVTKEFKDELSDYNNISGTKFLSNDGLGINSDLIMYNALVKAKENGKILMLHEELKDFYNIDYRISENLMVQRDIYLAKYVNTPIYLCHLSTKESIEMVRRAKKDGVSIICEVTPHHISMYENKFKVHPPIATKKDVEALILGIKDGVVDVIGTDHAPHGVEDKKNGAPGLVGLETAFCVSYTSLVKSGAINLSKLSELLSYNAAKLLDVNKGLVKEKFIADLVIVDLDKKIKVDSNKFFSKSKNTVFDGKEFYGEILMTIKDGKVMYRKEDYDNR